MICGRIDGAHLQRTAGLGPRVGHLVAGHQTVPLGGRIQRSDARASGSIDGEHERLLRIDRRWRRGAAGLRCHETQDRPPRQPD